MLSRAARSVLCGPALCSTLLGNFWRQARTFFLPGRQTPSLSQSMPQRRFCLQTRDFIMPCAPVGRLKVATGRWNGSGRCRQF